MRYFKMTQDVSIPGCWYLANPTDQQGREVDNPWQFRNGNRVNISGRLKVPVYQAGKPVDFSITGSNVPIVSEKMAAVFAELAPGDVQLIPVEVETQSEPFSILVCTRVVKCIDDARSGEVRYWKPEDGLPERAGQYRSVLRMRIDPMRVGDAKVFRTWGWTVALIISEDIKQALKQTGATGLDFQEV
jgi:hypothetical protein